MSPIRLIHWNASEAERRVKALRKAGYEVAYQLPDPPVLLRHLKSEPPLAVVIDLGRLPSQGRDIGLALRHYKSTRHVPIVFVEGDPAKVKLIQLRLPDAVYTAWDHIRAALNEAIEHPPVNPVAVSSLLEGYSGKPLSKKLGIKADSVVALIGAPKGFRRNLQDAGSNVRMSSQVSPRCNLIVWFIRSRHELEHGSIDMALCADGIPLWIAWPKKASGLHTDLTQQLVRRVGLATGLVDYKICSIDATWSGLLFGQRKTGLRG